MKRKVFYNIKKNKSPWSPPPLYDQKNKIFLDISAKAGTGFAASLFFGNMKHIGQIKNPIKYKFGVHYKKEIPIIYWDEILSSDIYKIKIVRNPFHRAISSYCHTMRSEPCISPEVKKNMSFIDFLKYISRPDGSMKRKNIHWQTQHRFIESEHVSFYDAVCRLENIEEDISKVNNEVIREWDIPKGANTYRHATSMSRTNAGNVASLRWGDFTKEHFPLYRNFYNDESSELVRKIYIKDIETYNYELGEL
tara:strand:+ start:539 stop:1291 length:753 start_codon:yes stop_codon:yes gene_type:complete